METDPTKYKLKNELQGLAKHSNCNYSFGFVDIPWVTEEDLNKKRGQEYGRATNRNSQPLISEMNRF
jgi:hypothetical protein